MEIIRRKEEQWKISDQRYEKAAERLFRIEHTKELRRLTPEEIAEKAQVKSLEKKEKVNEIISDLNSDMTKE